MNGLDDIGAVQMFYRALITVVIGPAVGWLVWQFKRFQTKADEDNKKYHGIIEDLRERQFKSEQNHAVTTVMMHNIQEDIKEIKHITEKILERRQFPRGGDK